jgi:hypothetical protein
LENWRNAPRIGKEKAAHIFKIASGIAITELTCQSCSQIQQDFFSILCAIRALLFLLDDAPANLIVCVDLQQVDAPCGTLASRQYQAADAVIKRIGILAFIHGNPQMSGKILALLASSVESLLLVDYA